MISYKELPRRASQAQQKQYAEGIGQVNSVVERLHAEGLLPERFAPEPLRLHPSLEGKVLREILTIGGKTAQEFLGEFAQNGIRVTSCARSMVESPDFTTSPEPEQIDTVRLHVRDLAIPKVYPTTDEIYGRIDELGLELLPAEAALQYFLQNGDRLRQGEVLFAGMKPIADHVGNPRVFFLVRNADRLWLRDAWTGPDDRWNPGHRFVFSLRPPASA